MTSWFEGGEPIGSLPLDERSWQFGDGVFETIAVREGRPRFVDWHLERARIGCSRLGIEPPSTDTLAEQVLAGIGKTKVDTTFATLKLVISGGRSPRGYARMPEASAEVYVGVFAASAIDATSYLEGVRVRLCNTRLARQPQLAGVKSLNRLEQVLARNEWRDPGVFEGLTFDTEGALVCGTMSNVFIVDDKALVTPDLSHAGVAGIMRRCVSENAINAGVDIVTRPIGMHEVLTSREMFLTNSQIGIVPVREIAGRDLEIGATTRRVMKMVRDAGVTEITC